MTFSWNVSFLFFCIRSELIPNVFLLGAALTGVGGGGAVVTGAEVWKGVAVTGAEGGRGTDVTGVEGGRCAAITGVEGGRGAAITGVEGGRCAMCQKVVG